MYQPKKEYYPAFLLEFKGHYFDAHALHAAFQKAKVNGRIRAQSTPEEFFTEFRIDEAHWEYHQRILHDDVLFRLVSEGSLHQTIHPVASIYNDQHFYSFVFPFIHTAILKYMANAIRKENTQAIKLLFQWVEPFGTYFHYPFFQMVEFVAEDVLIELNSAQINRRMVTFDTFSKVSPAMMHMLNRLPDHYQPYRDRFAGEVFHVAVWLHNDMKVYTQPGGMLTRLKLLNCSPELKAQITAQLKFWEHEKELANKPKFTLNHLIWIVPVVFILGYIVFRQTEWGKTEEDILEEQAIEVSEDKKAQDLKWDSINMVMDDIDMNKFIVQELVSFHNKRGIPAAPVAADKDPNRLDTGEEPYKDWLKPGRQLYPAFDVALEIQNNSECDMIIFVRQRISPFMERAYYVRSHRSLNIYDDGVPQYDMRVYAGTGWSDSLVVSHYDETLKENGFPVAAYDQLPATADLRGRFLYPAKSYATNTESVRCSNVANSGYYSSNGVPYVVIKGDHEEITFDTGQ